MNKVAMAIEELHRSENELAGQLLRVSDRNKMDHEVYHLARDLARWSQEHVRRLAEVGRDYGLDLHGGPRKDRELLAVTKECHPETLRQMRWANALVKDQPHR